MPEAPMRAIVWSTGWIGSIAIRAVNRRPDFALIGVWIHSPEKVGQDAGPLAGLEPIGLATTNDFEALLALAPDCVIYAASGPDRDGGGPRLRPYPRSRHQHCDGDFSGARVPARFRSHLDRGTHPGSTGWRSTLYASGIEPGFAADQLPLVLATQSNSIRFIWSSELFLYDQYPVTFIMMDVTGFGKPLDYEPMPAMPGS
jgi:hypothetical protein